MKKRLEAELISIAHRILKLKNKSEIIDLQKECLNLYENLSILRFVEQNYGDAYVEIPSDIEDKIQAKIDNLSIEDAQITRIETPETTSPEVISEAISETPMSNEVTMEPNIETYNPKAEQHIESEPETNNAFLTVIEPENPTESETLATTPQTGTAEVTDDFNTDVLENISMVENQEGVPTMTTEAIVEQEKAMDFNAIQPTFVQEAETLEMEPTPTISEDTFAIETAETPKIDPFEGESLENISFNDTEEEEEEESVQDITPEIAEQTAAPITSEVSPETPKTVFDFDSSFQEFEMQLSNAKPNQTLSMFDELPLETTQKSETTPTSEFEPVATPKVVSINDAVRKNFNIGLNDKIAFEFHLFGGRSEDFNRVLSQLNSFETFEQAKDFIINVVKPDYNNWMAKEEFENRFLEIIESKYI